MLRALLLFGFALSLGGGSPPPRAAGRLPQDAYVWQRAWTPQVIEAITQRATNFTALVALQAEVTWKGGQPVVARVPMNFSVLRHTERKVGVALRIGTFAGPFEAADQRGRFVIQLAQSLVEEARTNQLVVAEFQIDFDCAESKLEGYRVWVEAVRAAIKPVPLTITTLPSWLKNSSFQRLVSATDGYVLQVHSLERPTDPEARFDICDPAAALKAVERAGQLGIADLRLCLRV